MFNPFPFILEFGILAPTLLRLTLGLFFLFVGSTILFPKRKIFATYLSKQNTFLANTTVHILGILTASIGALFLIGFLTQYAALVSGILSIYFMNLYKENPKLLGHSYATYYFSILIAIAIFILGAGPFAIDLPL